MVQYRLRAVSDLAKTYQGPYGCDLHFSESIRIGRNVSGQDAYRLPIDWAQVSGNHCRVYRTAAEAVYYIEDTSTNGTYVNDKRITKKQPVVLEEGDRVRVSVAVDNDSSKVIEYLFERTGDQENPSFQGAKRQLPSPDVPEESRKRIRATSPAVPALQSSNTAILQTVTKLEASNKELRKKLEKERQQVELLEKRLAARDLSLTESSRNVEAALADVTSQVAEANAKVQVLEELSRQEQQAREEAENKLRHAQDVNADQQQELSAIHAEVARLKVAVEHVTADQQRLQGEAQRLADKLKDECTARTAAQEQLERQQVHNKEQAKQLAEALGMQAHLNAQLVAAQEDMLKQRQLRQDAETKLHAALSENESLQHSIHSMAEKIQGKEEGLAVQNAMLQTVNAFYQQSDHAWATLGSVMQQLWQAKEACDVAHSNVKEQLSFALMGGTSLDLEEATQTITQGTVVAQAHGSPSFQRCNNVRHPSTSISTPAVHQGPVRRAGETEAVQQEPNCNGRGGTQPNTQGDSGGAECCRSRRQISSSSAAQSSGGNGTGEGRGDEDNCRGKDEVTGRAADEEATDSGRQSGDGVGSEQGDVLADTEIDHEAGQQQLLPETAADTMPWQHTLMGGMADEFTGME